ncbi:MULTISPECIES: hypothetical protein [unclassified Streptomyces]|uniref:hypothetical protein n=1 Tax=unclassified Streptomyces TaxID=2593676 RepID=UPI0008859B15|nr:MULTISPECIES: hypothetical protein [unclassified Streptomyces]PBC87047.1 hypothetical protein BX261_7182 [Streptomyces sp. 2321.6]SDQ63315.1 hypothetical protein SAMN05216511_0066 [Streptomyces sp. KS_16]SEE17664.1 hypothetical protein SAMN05428940_7208 [Streptomyces sp. 2133.1]SNC74223.1 hypothetical protein SAMN06272741_7108 [Streptomyces sp. 2114.4]
MQLGGRASRGGSPPLARRAVPQQRLQTEEAEAEARRAYATEQNRRWHKHNPNGADAVAAATKAADAARERTAQYLLAERLEQLREQAAARTETTAAVPWRGWLPDLAIRPLDGDTAMAVHA